MRSCGLQDTLTFIGIAAQTSLEACSKPVLSPVVIALRKPPLPLYVAVHKALDWAMENQG